MHQSPVRLAFCVGTMDLGGSELNAIRTLERLDRRRFDVQVFHIGPQGPLIARYRALGVPLRHVRVRGFLRPGTLAAGISLARSLRHERIQILHAHDIYSNIFAIPFARLGRVPVTIASRRWHAAVPGQGHALANRIASRWATRVLANSAAVARSVVEEDGLSEGAVQIIPNFVEPAAFEEYPAAARARLFAALGIPADALVVGAVARLSAVKDHATLLRAALPVLAERPELHLLLVGEGPERGALEAQAAASGWEGRIHFAGEQPERPNPSALCDIAVLCSRTEGFPNSIIEAMAAGRPVLATAVGGTPDAVRPGETGLLVPSGDVAALTDALRALVAQPDLRRRLGEAGRQRARAEYAAEVVLARLADWYESLLEP